MKRKIFRSGNSTVVSLPQEALDSLALSEGDEVRLTVDREGRGVILRPVREEAGVDPDFDRRVSEFLDRYRPALEALADR